MDQRTFLWASCVLPGGGVHERALLRTTRPPCVHPSRGCVSAKPREREREREREALFRLCTHGGSGVLNARVTYVLVCAIIRGNPLCLRHRVPAQFSLEKTSVNGRSTPTRPPRKTIRQGPAPPRPKRQKTERIQNFQVTLRVRT